MDKMCPGCVFATTVYNIDDVNALINDNYQLDYTIYEKYFMGKVLDSNGNVTRSFACGKEKGRYFCLEGGVNESESTNKQVYDSNRNILEKIFSSSNCTEDKEEQKYSCVGDLYAGAYAESYVYVTDDNTGCSVNSLEYSDCEG